MRKRKILSLILIITISSSLLGASPRKIYLENQNNVIFNSTNIENTSLYNAGSFKISGNEDGWSYDTTNNTLIIDKSGDYSIEGNGLETTENIIVETGFIGTISIKDLNINVTEKDVSAFELMGNAHVTLILNEKNTMNSGIIEIEGGNIEAYAGENHSGKGMGGSGIGGGSYGIGKDITISGATIISTGSHWGSAIGGGTSSNGENINISGGTVTAHGGGLAAAIGGSKDGKNITITGGNIIAVGGFESAGIGNGSGLVNDRIYPSGSNITITGGNITATGGKDAYGIGSGLNSTASNIIFNNSSIKASSVSSTPVNLKGEPVSLLTIEDKPNIKSVNVDGIDYIIYSNHKDDNNLYLYLTKEDHYIDVTTASGSKKYKIEWDSNTNIFNSTTDSYIVSIPATTLNKDNQTTQIVSLSSVNLLDVNQKVKIKLSNSTDINNGNLKLNQTDGNRAITTLVSKNPNGVNPLNKNDEILSVSSGNSGSQPLYFQKPIPTVGNKVLAGNYIGNLTFIISIE